MDDKNFDAPEKLPVSGNDLETEPVDTETTELNEPVTDEEAKFLIGEIISSHEVESDSELEDEKVQRENELRASRLEIYDWIQCVVSTLIIVVLAFIFIGRQIGVDGTSMRDTLYHEDSVFVTNIFYTPRYGDIIIIKVEAFSDTPLVKRVIATEGQTIDINFDTHEVTVDGVVLYEPYIKEPTANKIDFVGPVTVPEGCVFVMGDNRNASRDSRDVQIGFVDTRSILGKVRLIIMPGEDSYGTRDWSRLGSVYKTTP